MWLIRRDVPPALPVLGRGKHRRPSQGACFMEMASLLAGERWTDHPSCTHPLLAELARMVNDSLPDAQRQRIVALIPSVIGLSGRDIRIDTELALMCAHAALPIAAAEKQRMLATGVLACERVLAIVEDRPTGSLRPRSQQALAMVPEAASWARRFAQDLAVSHHAFRTRSAPRIVGVSVEGIATACVPDADDRLVSLLGAGIELVSSYVASEAPSRAATRTRTRMPVPA